MGKSRWGAEPIRDLFAWNEEGYRWGSLCSNREKGDNPCMKNMRGRKLVGFQLWRNQNSGWPLQLIKYNHRGVSFLIGNNRISLPTPEKRTHVYVMKSEVGASYVRYTGKKVLKVKECLFSKEGEESRPTNDQQVSNGLPQKISWLGEVVGISAANVRGGCNGWISGIYSRKGVAKLNNEQGLRVSRQRKIRSRELQSLMCMINYNRNRDPISKSQYGRKGGTRMQGNSYMSK